MNSMFELILYIVNHIRIFKYSVCEEEFNPPISSTPKRVRTALLHCSSSVSPGIIIKNNYNSYPLN